MKCKEISYTACLTTRIASPYQHPLPEWDIRYNRKIYVDTHHCQPKSIPFTLGINSPWYCTFFEFQPYTPLQHHTASPNHSLLHHLNPRQPPIFSLSLQGGFLHHTTCSLFRSILFHQMYPNFLYVSS